uniref:Uncharacterized protein n=2 Tax=unclassified bacterial viruses TaxID=12333 RepID=A0AAU6VZJ0_9VIRU
MKVYIFNYVDEITSNYHDGGGLVVVAESLERAKEMFPQIGDTAPDDILETSEKFEKSYIFPDAGCC